jgi:hypothetical protein
MNNIDHNAIDQARTTLQQNLSASFADLRPHLRVLLAYLTVLRLDAPSLRSLPSGRATPANLEGTLDYLRQHWVPSQSDAYQSIGLSAVEVIGDTPDLLQLTFEGNIWSVGYMHQRITIACTGDDAFLCWRYQESGGVWGAAEGGCETSPPLANRS